MIKGILIGLGSSLIVILLAFLLNLYTFMEYHQPYRDSQQDTIINQIRRENLVIQKEFSEKNHNTNQRLNQTLDQLKEPIGKMQQDINQIKDDVKSTKKVVRFMMSTLKEMQKYQGVFDEDLSENHKDSTLFLTQKKCQNEKENQGNDNLNFRSDIPSHSHGDVSSQ